MAHKLYMDERTVMNKLLYEMSLCKGNVSNVLILIKCLSSKGDTLHLCYYNAPCTLSGKKPRSL